VLVDGKIVERGRHGQLLDKGGVYAGMWNRQREEEHAREVIEVVENEERSLGMAREVSLEAVDRQ